MTDTPDHLRSAADTMLTLADQTLNEAQGYDTDLRLPIYAKALTQALIALTLATLAGPPPASTSRTVTVGSST